MAHLAQTSPVPAPGVDPDTMRWPRLRALAGGAGVADDHRLTVPDEVLEELRWGPQRALRILVVAQEEIVHWGFRGLLGAQPWLERYDAAFDPAQALDAARRLAPHVVIIEVRSGDASGLALSAGLRRREPDVRVLLMSLGEGVSPRLARAAGAVGVISRSWGIADLLASIQLAAIGRTVFEEPPAPTGDVSDRERDIIRLIAGGATNQEIGDALHLSPNTVKQHASVLYRKLDVRNRAEAVQRAQRLGLIA